MCLTDQETAAKPAAPAPPARPPEAAAEATGLTGVDVWAIEGSESGA